jgi:hypothetical protein
MNYVFPVVILGLFALYGSTQSVLERYSYLFASVVERPIDSQVKWTSEGGRDVAREERGEDQPQARLVMIHNGSQADQFITLERDNDFGINRVMIGHDGASTYVLGVDGTVSTLNAQELRFDGLSLPARSQVYVLALADKPTMTVTRSRSSITRAGAAEIQEGFILSRGEMAIILFLSLFASGAAAGFGTWQFACLVHTKGWWGKGVR